MERNCESNFKASMEAVANFTVSRMQITKTVVLLVLISLVLFTRLGPPQVSAIGVANVVVTNVYWGANANTPDTAHPGDVNLQLSILITNVGDDVARNVSATLHVGPPLIYSYYVNQIAYQGTWISVIAGDIQQGANYVLTYTLSIDSKAQEGVYKYNLELNYRSARELQNIDTVVSVNVPIWRGELHVQGVVTTPTKIYVDSKQVSVQVTVANSGQGIAKNVQLKLLLQPPFTASSSGSDEIYVGNIPAGMTMNVAFIVDVAQNATFGQYSMILGEVVGNNTIPIGQVPLYVNEKVNFAIVSVTPTTFHAGDSGDVVSVVIRNAGSVEADSVRVELEVGNFVTGTLTDFLGTMLPNETKTAFFTIDIDAAAPPGTYTYTYNLRFDWTQDNNALYNDYSYSITFTILPPSGAIELVALLLLAGVGGGGYVFMRRRKAKAAAAAKPPTNQKA